MHHPEHARSFPLPHRRINRRSIENNSFDWLGPTETYELLKPPDSDRLLHRPNLRIARSQPFNWNRYDNHENFKFIDATHATLMSNDVDEKIKFDKHNDKKRSLIARLRSETNDEGDDMTEFDSSALEDRVKRILQKGKYRFIGDWLEKLHFVTIPIYQVGNWLPLIMSRWYCSGHGCGFDQISLEGKDGILYIFFQTISDSHFKNEFVFV